MIRTLLAFVVVMVLTGCSQSSQQPQPVPQVTSCHANGPYPDPVCTPGATNPDVTNSTLQTTICKVGWTTTIRPPVSYTEPLKLQQIKEYGYTDVKPQDYEEDHFIPLELGGSPTDPHNLWPESHSPVPGSYQKDSVENAAKAQVCSGKMALSDAQTQIATDWIALCKKLNADPQC